MHTAQGLLDMIDVDGRRIDQDGECFDRLRLEGRGRSNGHHAMGLARDFEGEDSDSGLGSMADPGQVSRQSRSPAALLTLAYRIREGRRAGTRIVERRKAGRRA